MTKEQIEFEAAKTGIGKQGVGGPYRLWPVDEKLVFRIHNSESGKLVPGVFFDPFHIGPAMTMRDALNEAWARAQAAVIKDYKELAKDSKTLNALTHTQQLAIEGLVEAAGRQGLLKMGYIRDGEL